jgi:hypothetical protein
MLTALQQRGVTGQGQGLRPTLALLPVELTAVEAALGIRVRNETARGRVGKADKTGELGLPALCHSLGQITLKIAKVQERRSRGVFLAHEQHRRRRRQQHAGRQRGQRAVATRCGGLLGNAVTQGTVTDLVVCLHRIDKGQRRQLRRRRTTWLASPVPRRLPLISKALGRRACEQWQRLGREVEVVAVSLASDQHMQRVMQVVVPLGVGQLRLAGSVA